MAAPVYTVLRAPTPATPAATPAPAMQAAAKVGRPQDANFWAMEQPLDPMGLAGAAAPAPSSHVAAGAPAAPPATALLEQGPGGVGDVDVTVMAYVQWISEMKQRATNAQYQQQAELDIVREALNQNRSELGELGRDLAHGQQQLRAQVSELRTEYDRRVTSEVGSLREELHARCAELEAARRDFAQQLSQVMSRAEADAQTMRVDAEMGSLRKLIGKSQDQTIGKFGEVDRAMSVFNKNINDNALSLRDELSETKQDGARGQELLGQAIATLSQDLAELQKHASTALTKLSSDVSRLENDVSRLENVAREAAASAATAAASAATAAATELVVAAAATATAPAGSGVHRSASDSTPPVPVRHTPGEEANQAEQEALRAGGQPHGGAPLGAAGAAHHGHRRSLPPPSLLQDSSPIKELKGQAQTMMIPTSSAGGLQQAQLAGRYTNVQVRAPGQPTGPGRPSLI